LIGDFGSSEASGSSLFRAQFLVVKVEVRIAVAPLLIFPSVLQILYQSYLKHSVSESGKIEEKLTIATNLVNYLKF